MPLGSTEIHSRILLEFASQISQMSAKSFAKNAGMFEREECLRNRHVHKTESYCISSVFQ